MDISLDDYIRDKSGHRNHQPNMSLDEYITLNKIDKPATQNNKNQQLLSGVSKFDRYKRQDDDDEMDEEGLPKAMPKLVPFGVKTMPQKPIYQRLGKRNSVCESIHTSQMKLYRPMKARRSVQSRLGKNYVNPAVIERNRIAVHALNTYAKNAANIDDVQGQILIDAFKKSISVCNAIQNVSEPPKKYDMKIQKEISMLQGKELYYACPGAFIISNDGPGVNGLNRIPNDTTHMSMNQRFA